MRMIGTSFNRLSGPDATASYKLEFNVDEANRESLKQLLDLRKGTEILLAMYVTGEDDKEINTLVTESEDDTKKRLNKRMHAIMTDIAANSGKSKNDIKIILKKYLINQKIIKKSSAEMDVRGYSIAIHYLEHEFHR